MNMTRCALFLLAGLDSITRLTERGRKLHAFVKAFEKPEAPSPQNQTKKQSKGKQTIRLVKREMEPGGTAASEWRNVK